MYLILMSLNFTYFLTCFFLPCNLPSLRSVNIIPHNLCPYQRNVKLYFRMEFWLLRWKCEIFDRLMATTPTWPPLVDFWPVARHENDFKFVVFGAGLLARSVIVNYLWLGRIRETASGLGLPESRSSAPWLPWVLRNPLPISIACQLHSVRLPFFRVIFWNWHLVGDERDLHKTHPQRHTQTNTLKITRTLRKNNIFP